MSVDPTNSYTQVQQKYYDGEAHSGRMNKQNHSVHNNNQDYWDVLVGMTAVGYEDKVGLDFGCGCGRNILNLIDRFARFDGVDISQGLLDQSRENLLAAGHDESRFRLIKSNGVDLADVESDGYDFIMSTIVLQHIPVYDIRRQLLEEFYRVLRSGGLLSFQMRYKKGFTGDGECAGYHKNAYDKKVTNGAYDVIVGDSAQLEDDLSGIGFVGIEFDVCDGFMDRKADWIYVRASKD